MQNPRPHNLLCITRQARVYLRSKGRGGEHPENSVSLLESFFCTPGFPCNPRLWVMLSVTGNLSPRDSVVWASGLVVARTFWASGDEGTGWCEQVTAGTLLVREGGSMQLQWLLKG